ncbi:MAG: tRNA (guanosine(37)-N1)-methyltransferase TrmD, partial [Steroidobacteraceae bacterium]
MKIVVVTLFPDLVRGALEHGVLGRAIARGLVQIECVDPRQFASDVHKTVDDRPYGGGPGMVGTPGPWAAAIDLASSLVAAGTPRVHLSAQGERFDQAMARDFAALPGLVLVASRYEGLDQRVVDAR